MNLRFVAMITALIAAVQVRLGYCQSPTVDAIRQDWQARSDRIKSGELTWSEVKHMPAGSITRKGTPMPGPGGKAETDMPPQDTSFTYNRSLTFDSTKLRYTDTEPIWSGADSTFDTARSTTKSWNDKVYKQLDTSSLDKMNHSRGTVGEHARSIWSMAVLEPVLMHLRPPVNHEYDVVSTNAAINGVSCTLLRSRGVTNPQELLWVDSKKDSSIIRRILQRNGIPAIQVDVTYMQAAGDWIPMSWQIQVFMDANGRPMTYRGTLKEHKLNPEIDPQVFELEFPAGTLVNDPARGPKQDWYLVRRDLQERPVTREELIRTRDIEELMTTWPEGITPRDVWFTRIAYGALALVLIVGGVVFLKRRWAS